MAEYNLLPLGGTSRTPASMHVALDPSTDPNDAKPPTPPPTICSQLKMNCSYPEPGNPGFVTQIYGPADQAGNCYQYEYSPTAKTCELINNRVNCVAACKGH